MVINPTNYENFLVGSESSKVTLIDHLGGFNRDLQCSVLDRLSATCSNKFLVETEYILSEEIKQKYPGLDLQHSVELWCEKNFVKEFESYTQHPELGFENFVCSFNGSVHIGRKLLVSILQKMQWFDPAFCSKNFSFNSNNIDGHLLDYLPDDDARIYSKFFSNTEEFNRAIYSFGHVRFNHSTNIFKLEQQLTQSFVHLVSETLATSFYPFVTEKFLYSVVTRGLFLAYAQPGWHSHLENFYGFKKYNKLFDYCFDEIQNPVERLVELIAMLSKFSVLKSDDWRDLYLIEQDTIEFNYDHYFSGSYLAKLKTHAYRS